jgi:hypothetical protein
MESVHTNMHVRIRKFAAIMKNTQVRSEWHSNEKKTCNKRFQTLTTGYILFCVYNSLEHTIDALLLLTTIVFIFLSFSLSLSSNRHKMHTHSHTWCFCNKVWNLFVCFPSFVLPFYFLIFCVCVCVVKDKKHRIIFMISAIIYA